MMTKAAHNNDDDDYAGDGQPHYFEDGKVGMSYNRQRISWQICRHYKWLMINTFSSGPLTAFGTYLGRWCYLAILLGDQQLSRH